MVGMIGMDERNVLYMEDRTAKISLNVSDAVRGLTEWIGESSLDFYEWLLYSQLYCARRRRDSR